VGYDINCGVRLLRTALTKPEVLPRLKELVNLLFTAIPSGVGSRGKVRLTKETQARPLMEGARWAVAEGMGEPEDLVFAEAGGCIPGADPDAVSHKAYERGRDQAGTLGSGNHFEEVQVVDHIYDEQAANVMGLFPGQVTVLMHTGSRGFGHQVCTDYLTTMERAVKKYGIQLADRQLACAPFDSNEAQAYLGAMRAAANYAWPTASASPIDREVFERIFKQFTHLGLGIYESRTTSPSSRSTRSTADPCGSWSIGRARRGPSRRDTQSFPKATGPLASRSSSPATWGGRRSSWWGLRAP
jgi:tRNA-splicing ligase RtcB